MVKLNISGGEPYLQGDFIGEVFRYCKDELNLESCSVVTNGSKVTERWLDTYGKYLDIMAISCDSFDPETNVLIGRTAARRMPALADMSDASARWPRCADSTTSRSR
jgi:radical S-adenosyl methionine domain-containing protein 2